MTSLNQVPSSSSEEFTEITDPEKRDVIMEVRDATVRFSMEHGETRVLDSVSVDIRRNEIFGIVGESGSGKSMFADALLDAIVDPGVLTGQLTYHPPSGGTVDVLDLSKEQLKEYRWNEVSMVFQGAMSSFNPVRTIRTHFEETIRAHNHDFDEGMERANQLLEDLYLDPERVLDSYPHELSGGMKQRALIALSLILEPEMLVMDEPTAALDLLMQRSIITLIQELQDKYDLTIIFITHDLPLIADLADRLTVMYAFEFVELGPAYDVLKNAGHPYTRALLKATPNLTTPTGEMRPIEGNAPDPANKPSGCPYSPRCPLADDWCEEEAPPPYEMTADHLVRCHYWEDAMEDIPLDWEGSEV